MLYSWFKSVNFQVKTKPGLTKLDGLQIRGWGVRHQSYGVRLVQGWSMVDLGIRVQGSGFRAQGSRFRVWV